MNITLMDAIKLVSARNPGALSVCLQLVDHLDVMAFFDFGCLLGMGITGPDVWVLYEHCCKSDIAQLHAAIMEEGKAVEMLRSVRGSSFWRVPEREVG